MSYLGSRLALWGKMEELLADFECVVVVDKISESEEPCWETLCEWKVRA